MVQRLNAGERKHLYETPPQLWIDVDRSVRTAWRAPGLHSAAAGGPIRTSLLVGQGGGNRLFCHRGHVWTDLGRVYELDRHSALARNTSQVGTRGATL